MVKLYLLFHIVSKVGAHHWKCHYRWAYCCWKRRFLNSSYHLSVTCFSFWATFVPFLGIIIISASFLALVVLRFQEHMLFASFFLLVTIFNLSCHWWSLECRLIALFKSSRSEKEYFCNASLYLVTKVSSLKTAFQNSSIKEVLMLIRSFHRAKLKLKPKEGNAFTHTSFSSQF